MIKVTVKKDLIDKAIVVTNSYYRLDIIHEMQPINDWCKDNCTGIWLWSSLRVFKFESEDDAALFKLVWG